MPIYVGANSFKIHDDTTAGDNFKMTFSATADYMWQKRLGGVGSNSNSTVANHFEGWCCYVGYGAGGGFGGTVMAGEDRADMTVTTTGASQGYSFTKSGSQTALVINAGSNAITNVSFVGFIMRF